MGQLEFLKAFYVKTLLPEINWLKTPKEALLIKQFPY